MNKIILNKALASLLFALVLTLLTGCGQKGPLTRPDPTAFPLSSGSQP